MLSSRHTVVALERAVADRQPQAGLVHHSDRGLQYASPEYVAALDRYGIAASMSSPANPYDNASYESFMKTLKRKEICANRYANLEQLHTNIEEFMDGPAIARLAARTNATRWPIPDTNIDKLRNRPYADRMNLQVPPELEAKLTRLAAETGRTVDQVALDLLATSMDHDEWFRGEVERGRTAAREGRLLEHDDVAARMDRRYRS